MIDLVLKEKIECALEKLPETEQQRVADFADALLKTQPKKKGMTGKEFVEWAKSFPPEDAAEFAAILDEENEKQKALVNWMQGNGV